MAKNSQTPPVTQQQTSVQLTPEQRQLMGLAMPSLTEFANSTASTPSFSGVSPFNANQTAAQNAALGAAEVQKGLANTGAQTSTALMDGTYLRADSNPYLGGYIDAATRPIERNLTENVLPAVRSEALQGGQFGGSRRGNAEGLAAGRTQEAIGDTTAKIASDAYGRGLDQMSRSLALLPQTVGSQTAAAGTTGTVGDVQQANEQARLDEQTQKFWYEKMFPLFKGSSVAGLVSGLPGAGATTVATGAAPPKPNPLLAGLGGAMSGAAMGSSFGPWGALIGGAGGAGIGFLGSR